MRKKVNKYGNRTYTVQELQELLPKLEGDRTAAQALGKKMGMRIYIIDLLRGLLGFTATTPAKIPQEKIDKLIKVFNDNPEKSLYQIFREYKDKIGLSGGYQTYYAIIRKAGLEYTIRLIDEYRAEGVDGIHLYALNHDANVTYIAKNSGIVDYV